ncbi:MAG: hypothetical protein ACI841_005336 [Planctomycetota bacterium]|jgi:hypothetical protein
MRHEYDKLASAELERHKPEMLYADRQMMKVGDYGAFARKVKTRSYTNLAVGIGSAAS